MQKSRASWNEGGHLEAAETARVQLWLAAQLDLHRQWLMRLLLQNDSQLLQLIVQPSMPQLGPKESS